MKDNIILVHKGALGDFLQIWPSICSLKMQFPKKNIFWAGKKEYFFFLEPLGIKRLSPQKVSELNKIYTSTSWPESLEEFDVIWFGLLKPPTTYDFPNLYFIPGITKNHYIPVYKSYLYGINKIGILPYNNWQKKWLSFFKIPHSNSYNSSTVVILPGSGHIKKCWKLENFIEIAKWLETKKYKPLFVLGPAEIERGVKVKNFVPTYLTSIKDLVRVISTASLVIGNDSGPVHLSSYMNVPTIALFGPTSPIQWGPIKAKIIYKELKCSPCTQMANIDCPLPICMENITVKDVKRAIKSIFMQKQNRSLTHPGPRTCLVQKEKGY